MKQLCILFILFKSCSVFAQEKDTVKAVRWKLGAVYSPDYCYRLLKCAAAYQGIKEERDKKEQRVFGYTTGLSAVAYINRVIGMEAGIYYTKKGEEGNITQNIYSPKSQYKSYSYHYRYSYEYLEFPLKLICAFSRRRMSFFVNAGIGVDVMLKPQVEFTYSLTGYSNNATVFSETDKQILDKDFYRRINLSTIVGLGISYKMTEKLAITVEPTYTQLLTPIYFKDIRMIYSISEPYKYAFKEYPFSIGSRVGVHYLFY